MKYLFVLLLLGGTSVVHAQTETAEQPNCADIKGLQISFFDRELIPENYTGIRITCFDWGKVDQFWNYKDGKRNGLCRNWYNNGQLNYEKNYEEDHLHGLSRNWYKNGNLLLEGKYKDGKEDGLWRLWYENGQLKSECNYKDGEAISFKCWDEDGNEIECD